MVRDTGVSGFVEDVRHAGDELSRLSEGLVTYLETASGQLRHVADRLRQSEASDLAAEVAAFGQRRPALFVAAAFIAGLSLARFFKSSSDLTMRPALAGRARRGDR